MNRFWGRASSLYLVFCMVATWFMLPAHSAQAAGDTGEQQRLERAQTVVQGLTPEERIGQLFLITFKGNSADSTSQIYDLITNYHVGGVVLKASNDNFTGPDGTVAETQRLISEIQTDEWTASRKNITDPQTGITRTPSYIPVFVGIQQDGDGYPSDQILSGLTQMPSQLSIGATWKPELAYQVGQVTGQELSALGVNLFFGPALDLLESPNLDGNSELGSRSFGGSPYWVGEMGKAYIAGMHAGSQEKIAVISTHFPGYGAADRNPQEEVPTVRKSLNSLMQTDFAPFFTVTGNSPTVEASVDGLMVANMRYTGLQGNVRSITRPVSLDPAAISQLVGLPAISTWYDSGGILVSDDLGSRAVRQVYDPTMKTFDSRQVAREAFLAGNDLLYADNFIASGDDNQYTTILRTLQFFAQKYREDPTFAQRVDSAVTRILALKLRLYPVFDLGTVLTAQDSTDIIQAAQSQQVAYNVATQAFTLINPQLSDIDTVLPQPPARTERIVFFTDTQTTRQCSQCPDVDSMPVDGLQNAVLKLYGPQASGQVTSTYLSSYSFADLTNYLNGFNGYQALEDDLHAADWMVFSVLNPSQSRPNSMALQRLLNERPDLIQKNQRLVVFAFNAPNYLDATGISKVTAYYGAFSKVPSFQEAAVRVLFHELTPSGSLPLSVPSVGYDLSYALSPDPTQVIPLSIDLQSSQLPTVFPPPQNTLTPEPAPAQTFNIGDTIPLTTGVIHDRNHHTVPDGTIVHFILIRNGDATTVQQIDSATSQGVAKAAFRIERDGLLEIRAASGDAQTSINLRLAILQGVGAGVTAVPPTPTETPTPTPTPTPTITTTPSETVVTIMTPPHPYFGDWLLSILLIGFSSAGIYFIGVLWGSVRWGVRWALCGILGGLTVYTYLAVGLPGSVPWVVESGRAGILGLTFAGILFGWGVGVGWRTWLQQKSARRLQH